MEMGVANMARIIFIMLLSVIALAGCATTNFSKSNSPATVTEQWTRESFAVWGGPRIYRINNVAIGYSDKSGRTYTIDSGRVDLRVWYYANEGRYDGMFWQTDPVNLPVMLEPNGKYEVRAETDEKTAKFRLVDVSNNETVATKETSLVLRPSPIPMNVPLFIPIVTR